MDWLSCTEILFFFFFSSRRRHTRSLCDWSSDVCSSDLFDVPELLRDTVQEVHSEYGGDERDEYTPEGRPATQGHPGTHEQREDGKEGRALGRAVIVAFGRDLRVPGPVPVGPVIQETWRLQGPARLRPGEQGHRGRPHPEEKDARESEDREDEGQR